MKEYLIFIPAENIQENSETIYKHELTNDGHCYNYPIGTYCYTVYDGHWYVNIYDEDRSTFQNRIWNLIEDITYFNSIPKDILLTKETVLILLGNPS